MLNYLFNSSPFWVHFASVEQTEGQTLIFPTMGAVDLMEIPGFGVAAGKRIGVEFTNTPFHTVKLNYVLLRLGALCHLDYISPGAAWSLRVKGGWWQHISAKARENINKIKFYLLRFALTQTQGADILLKQRVMDKKWKTTRQITFFSTNLRLTLMTVYR